MARYVVITANTGRCLSEEGPVVSAFIVEAFVPPPATAAGEGARPPRLIGSVLATCALDEDATLPGLSSSEDRLL